MSRPAAPHHVARIFTTVITAAVWCGILLLTGYASVGGFKKEVVHAAPVIMANVAAWGLLFIPYFATQGVLISMLDGVTKKRILAPDAIDKATAHVSNPWRLGAIHALVVGLVPAAVAYFLGIRAGVDTMTPGGFAVRYAMAGTLLCAGIAWTVAGDPFMRIARLPRELRVFQGDPKRYLSTHFAWPHGIANAIINGALAFLLSPVSFAEAGAIVPTKNVVGDLVITFLVLTWLITSGTKTQARVETQWGIAPPAAASSNAVPTAFLVAFFAGIGFSIVAGIAFAVTKTPGLSIVSWAFFRGIVFGVYSAWLSARVAAATINSVLNPEKSEESAPKSQAA
jgi:hypothetical protein